MSRERRVFHEGPAPSPGDLLDLSRDEAHHVLRVLRLRAGDALRVFDGRGGEWEASLVSSAGSSARARIGEAVTSAVESPLTVVLFQALCRSDRMELVVQKGTEIGLRAIRPWPAVRSESPMPSAKRLERWRRIAIESCKQSGRRTAPSIEPLESLPTPPDDASVAALVLDAAEAGRPIGERLAGASGREVWLAVGPEGGFDEGEREAALAGGWLACSLGPRTLRTETAGLVAAALVLHRWGDLGSI